jgi:hypothetical protein
VNLGLDYVIDMMSKVGFPFLVASIAIVFGVLTANEILALVRRRLRANEDLTTRRMIRESNDENLTPGPLPTVGGARQALSKKIPEKGRPPLCNHYFFTQSNNMICNKIKTIRCGCPGRTEVFRDMCHELCQSWDQMMKDFISDERSSLFKITDFQLGPDIMNAITKWRSELANRWMRRSVPQPAIDAMLDWIAPRIDLLSLNSGGLADSDFFNDNYERMAAILAVHEMTMQLLIIDMNRLIMSINGNLDGIVYHGISISPAKDVLTEYFERQKAVNGTGSRSMRTPLPGTIVDHSTPIRVEQAPAGG